MSGLFFGKLEYFNVIDKNKITTLIPNCHNHILIICSMDLSPFNTTRFFQSFIEFKGILIALKREVEFVKLKEPNKIQELIPQ